MSTPNDEPGPYDAWIGRSETVEAVATAESGRQLAEMFDLPEGFDRPGFVPSMAHWFLFRPKVRRSETGPDGHAMRGGLLPPVPLPRRMWAAGELTFQGDIPVGETVRRRSTVAAITQKHGRSGELVFVDVDHALLVGERVAVTERHAVVYRAITPQAPAAPGAFDPAAWDIVETVTPDAWLLFRYSMATGNGHRIHYDLDYCRTVELYPGLIVHGPLTATLLALLARRLAKAALATFRFRALAPLFHDAPFCIAARVQGSEIDLAAIAPNGHTAIAATATLA